MFSQTVEYALRAIVILCDEAPRPRTSEQIAQVTLVPQAYLPKVMQSLIRAGLVKSQRGPKGGFSLTKAPEQLTVLEVINAVDPIMRIHDCPLGITGHEGLLCPLHRRLDKTLEMVEDVFRQTTLAMILSETTGSRPLCRTDDPATETVQIDVTTTTPPEQPQV